MAAHPTYTHISSIMDPDGLVATRARRANAGLRLKQLIQIEEQASEVLNLVYNDDDDNVRLLFQEDENDGEFEESEQESEEEDDGDEEEGEDAPENADTETDGQDNEKIDQVLDDGAAVNPDEMLSDSDLSASDVDNSEGEVELQREERARKRKKRTGPVIPAIKKPRFQKEKKPVPPRTPEAVLVTERRASSRKSAIQNKQRLEERLREDEVRRAALPQVVRPTFREMTQEERLAEAVETEKANIASLNMFLEQEVLRKERQKNILHLRRPPLSNVVRFYSAETLVTPLDEIEDARHVLGLFDKKKKRRRRLYGDEPDKRLPGDVDPELPYYRREMEELRRRELIEVEQRRQQQLEEERRRFLESQGRGPDGQLLNKETGNGAEKMGEDRAEAAEKQDLQTENLAQGNEIERTVPGEETEDQMEKPVPGEKAEEPESEAKPESTQDGHIEKEKEATASLDASMEPEADASSESIKKEVTEEVEAAPSQGAKKEGTPGTPRRVTFATPEEEATDQEEQKPIVKQDDDVDYDNEFEEPESLYRPGADGSIYEGPVQHVARNLVFLLNFDDQERWGLTEVKVKSVLFGEDAHLGPGRRHGDMKTILKSSVRLNNPYAKTQDDTPDELLVPVNTITEESPIFEVLTKLPRLGDKEIWEEEEFVHDVVDNDEVRIKTDTPSGLYLPNGNKKACFISGREVRYFDPTTGVPYDDKDVFQIIKAVEAGAYAFYSMGKDQNNYGAVELYLNNRQDGRHAKGVPEGFAE